ncbi:peptidoglycan-associated lipoprotein Pal [Hydrogenophaga sp. 5NK40-0174]|uniref:peptidoglycan-associated lipoprotein Pal n=1 Tax=Hydrogenophaga sp. 5NK40-0174 TaxID=3127649 RepID=UPI00333EF852
MTLTLAACGSNVKLDEQAAVEDRNAAGANGGVNGGGVGGANGGSVDGSTLGQPGEMERVVYFDYDSFEVRAEATSILEANATYLRGNAGRSVALEGHTDERGSREYNLALGQKRAEAVRRALSLMGVADEQMEPVSFGEEKPAVMGYDEDSFAKNRRVELTYR